MKINQQKVLDLHSTSTREEVSQSDLPSRDSAVGDVVRQMPPPEVTSDILTAVMLKPHYLGCSQQRNRGGGWEH